MLTCYHFTNKLLAAVNVMLLYLSVKFELRWCLDKHCFLLLFSSSPLSAVLDSLCMSRSSVLVFLPAACQCPWWGSFLLLLVLSWNKSTFSPPPCLLSCYTFLLCFWYLQLSLIWNGSLLMFVLLPLVCVSVFAVFLNTFPSPCKQCL